MIANETDTKLGLLQQCPQHDFSSNPVIITSCHTVMVYIVMEPWHHTVYDSASSWHKGSTIALTAILKTRVYNWLDVFINETETQTQKRVKAIKILMSKFTNNNKCWHSKVTTKLSLKFKLMTTTLQSCYTIYYGHLMMSLYNITLVSHVLLFY